MSTATLTSVRLAAPARAPRPAGTPRVRAAAPRGSAPRPGIVLTARGRRLVRVLVLGAATAVLAVALVLAWVTVAASVAPGASAGDGGVQAGTEVLVPVG